MLQTQNVAQLTEFKDYLTGAQEDDYDEEDLEEDCEESEEDEDFTIDEDIMELTSGNEEERLKQS